MTDTLRKVNPGDPLSIPAATFNAFVDAARASQRARAIGAAGTSDTLSDQTTVLVRNDAGVDVPRFGVLGIGGPIFAPEDGLDEWFQQTSLKGVLPSSATHHGRFVVTLEPIDAGKVGVACLSGLVLCRVDGFSGSARFADVADGQAGYLRAAPRGAAQILWREPGASQEWAIVRVGPPNETGFYATITASTPVAGQPNRWMYDWAEVVKVGTGYGGWNQPVGARIGAGASAARNLAEDMNTATGVQGHGIDVTRAGFPAGFATVPAPAGLIVRIFAVVNASGTAEHWFNFGGNVDGTCT